MKFILIFLAMLCVFISVPTAWAAYLDVSIDPKQKTIQPEFKFLKTVVIEYGENNNEISDLLRGRTFHMSFTENSSSNQSLIELIKKMNQYLASKKSQTHITDIEVQYHVDLSGKTTQTIIDYRLVLKPTIDNFVSSDENLQEGIVGFVTSEWRGISITSSVIIHTAKFGKVEVNYPMSFVQSNFPSLYSKLIGTDAEKLLSQNMIDASVIEKTPLRKWNFLFDPSSTNSQYSRTHYFLNTVETPPNIEQMKIIDLDVPYIIKTIQPTDEAKIEVMGFASVQKLNDIETFAVSENPPLRSGMVSTNNIYLLFSLVLIFSIVSVLVIKFRLKRK